MSASAFPHAKVLTSHRKAIMTVRIKSYRRKAFIIRFSKKLHEYTQENKAETTSVISK